LKADNEFLSLNYYAVPLCADLLLCEALVKGFSPWNLFFSHVFDCFNGQAICLMVESKDELKTVGDYKVSGGGEAPSPPKKEESAPPPPPPKQEESKPAPSEPPPASPSPQPSGDRVFATPVARKLAEDKSVRTCNLFFSVLAILAECVAYFRRSLGLKLTMVFSLQE